MSQSYTAALIVLLALFLLLHALFAAWETAVIGIKDKKLERLALSESKAKKLEKLTNKAQRFLSAMRTGQTLCVLAGACTSLFAFSARLAGCIQSLPFRVGQKTAMTLSCALILLAACFFIQCFCSLIPKKLASNAENFALSSAGAISFFCALFTPLNKLVLFTAKGVLKLFGASVEASNGKVTEEEILMMVDAGEEEGAIHEDEKTMIENVFEFNDTFVDEIMTHRTEMVCLSSDATLSDAVEVATDKGYSRIPVYEEDIDHITGILYIKDILPFAGKMPKDAFRLQNLLHPVYFVPESQKANSLFRQLQKDKNHMAIVVDEYGGTAGLITMEDLIESVMGDIIDEYDKEEPDIKKINETTYLLDGGTDIDEISDLFSKDFTSEDYDTLGGFLIAQLGRIPADGETPVARVSGITFEILLVEDRRIVSVKAHIDEPAGKEPEK